MPYKRRYYLRHKPFLKLFVRKDDSYLGHMFNHTSIEQNVDRFSSGEKDIYVIGTAHISNQSIELVARQIEAIGPDSLVVELCESRFKSLKDPDRWKNTDLFTVIRQGKAHILLAQLLLAAYQKKVGSQLSVRPGAEMMKAVTLAEAAGIPVVLGDRDITITLKRTWASLGTVALCKLAFSTIRSMLDKDQVVSEEEIERLKSADALEAVMNEFSHSLPGVRTALIDERDRYLTHAIAHAPGKRIVAVVGAAHVPGIRAAINSNISVDEISKPPKKRFRTKILTWLIPVGLILGMVYSFFAAGSETFAEIFKTWFWFTAIAGALGAAVVRAHPLTTLSAFICAPFAALNPFVAAGWIAGLVEAFVRRPQVRDLESIIDDMGSIQGILRNRVSRTLVIVASTNFFVMAGMTVAGLRVYHIATDVQAVQPSPVPNEP